MKMNKGFTLVELLGVIIILALLAMITIPTVGTVIKNGKEKTDAQVKDNIVLAAKNWAIDNKGSLPINVNEKIFVNIDVLQNEGYIDKDIKMPSSQEVINGVCVEIVNVTSDDSVKNVYEYSYSESCS